MRVGRRPGAEFLAVIAEDDVRRLTRARIGDLPQLCNYVLDIAPRNGVSQALAAGEEPYALALVLGDVVAVELIVAHAGHAKVRVVDERPLHAGVGERCGKGRLPDAFGEPQTGRRLPELLLEKARELVDLAALIGVEDHRQNRLVVAAGDHLDLAAIAQRAKPRHVLGPVCDDPVEEAAGVVERDANTRMAFERGEHRFVRLLVDLLDDEAVVPDRLVIVEHDAEMQARHTGDPSRSGTRAGVVAAQSIGCRRSRAARVPRRSFHPRSRCLQVRIKDASGVCGRKRTRSVPGGPSRYSIRPLLPDSLKALRSAGVDIGLLRP